MRIDLKKQLQFYKYPGPNLWMFTDLSSQNGQKNEMFTPKCLTAL